MSEPAGLKDTLKKVLRGALRAGPINEASAINLDSPGSTKHVSSRQRIVQKNGDITVTETREERSS